MTDELKYIIRGKQHEPRAALLVYTGVLQQLRFAVFQGMVHLL